MSQSAEGPDDFRFDVQSQSDCWHHDDLTRAEASDHSHSQRPTTASRTWTVTSADIAVCHQSADESLSSPHTCVGDDGKLSMATAPSTPQTNATVKTGVFAAAAYAGSWSAVTEYQVCLLRSSLRQCADISSGRLLAARTDPVFADHRHMRQR